MSLRAKPVSSKFFRDVDTVAERRAKLRQTTDLAPGEVILWRGRPKRGIVFVGFDLILVPFSLVWAGTVGMFPFAAPGQLKQLKDMPVPVIGIMLLFLSAAFYITIGRFMLDAYYRSRLRYMITNQRVTIELKTRLGLVRSYDLHALKLSLAETRDGRGSINLNYESWDGAWRYVSGYLPLSHATGPILFRIKDARHVYEILRKAQAEALASQATK